MNEFTGVLTGKGLEWGGSLIRPEATGYGAVYFAAEMLATRKLDFKGKRAAVSGSGNVSQYAIEKLNQLGALAITASDSNGTIVDEAGISGERWDFLMNLNVPCLRLKSALMKLWDAAEPLLDVPLDRVTQLTRTRYQDPAWNFKF